MNFKDLNIIFYFCIVDFYFSCFIKKLLSAKSSSQHLFSIGILYNSGYICYINVFMYNKSIFFNLKTK